MESDGLEVTGSLVTRDPFTAAELQRKLAKQQAEKKALEEERARQKAAEKAEVAAKREAARLQKEADLAEQIKQRTADFERQERQREQEEARIRAEQERQQQLEEERQRKREEEEARQRQQRAELARREREEKERQRREEKEAAKRAAHEARMKQMQEEEERAEAFARQIAETRKLSQQLELAKRKGSLDPSAQLPVEINSTDPEEREAAIAKARAFIPDIKEEPLAKPSALINAERDRQLKLKEAAEQERLQREEEERLKHLGMQGLIGRLKSPAMKESALLDIQRELIAIVGTEGMDGISSRVGKTAAFDLTNLVKPISDIVMNAPGCIPGIVVLGILQFAGNPRLTDTVVETRRIPADYNEWLGALLGCRLFFEYQAHIQSGSSTPWKAAAEQGRVPDVKVVEASAREQQRKAAKDKVVQLIERYGDASEAATLSASIMTKFDSIARAHDARFQKFNSTLEQENRKMQEELDRIPLEAQSMLDNSRRDADKLQVLRRQADTASEKARKAKGDLLRASAKADAAREGLQANRKGYLNSRLAEIKSDAK